MHWLLERGGPLDRFNQSMLLQVPARMREADLTSALQAVLDHHDALRVRLEAAAGGGGWEPGGAPAGGGDGGGGRRPNHIGGLEASGLQAGIAQRARAAEASPCP